MVRVGRPVMVLGRFTDSELAKGLDRGRGCPEEDREGPKGVAAQVGECGFEKPPWGDSIFGIPTNSTKKSLEAATWRPVQ